MIDEEGYRPNVGIIIANSQKELLFCRRLGRQDAWQFPQGGIKQGETPQQALYRELKEELGLNPGDVTIIAESTQWLKYDLPERYRRYRMKPLCIGQKQKWFLLALSAAEEAIQLDQSHEPEFDCWEWVAYWYPLEKIIAFKREVYQQILQEFAEQVGVDPA